MARITFSLDEDKLYLPANFYIDDLRIVKLGATVNVDERTSEIPQKFSLEQNYPNPFNPTTSIQYSVGSQSHIVLKVYDVLGNEAAVLVNEEKPAGTYEVNFDAVNSENGRELSSGVYFYRIAIHSDKIQAGDFVETKKMILLR